MKKIILKCITFLAILFLILIILSKIFIPKNNTKEAGIPKNKIKQTGVLAEPENTLDVIIMGDSESYTSFIPLEAWNKYGYTSYVCGSPAQKLPAIETMLQEILKKQQPKIVMLEANTIYQKASLTAPIVQIGNKILPIIQYHNRWKNINQNDFFGKVEYTKIQRDKGFYFSEKIDPGKNKNYMKKSNKTTKIARINKLYVKMIKKYCDSKGIEFILYSSPSPVNWTTSKHNGIKSLAKELGVEYIDLNLMTDKLSIDWEKDSRDKGDHLNYTGSLKTTAVLADYLNNKNLPNHKNDELYKSWDKYYKKYIKKVNSTKK